MALGKEVFAECPLAGTWQTITAMTGNGRGERMQRTREAVCRVLPTWHSAKAGLPSVCKQALGKANLCRVSFCCRVSFGRHSANCNFAECSIYCSRQRLQHSANIGFPVVGVTDGRVYICNVTTCIERKGRSEVLGAALEECVCVWLTETSCAGDAAYHLHLAARVVTEGCQLSSTSSV